MIARQAADGLAAAPAAGLVHRDVKPSNVWLEAGANGAFRRVRALDFGLARSFREDDWLTDSGVTVGPPAYMAPEEARGKPVDARADLFALGATRYHAATGPSTARTRRPSWPPLCWTPRPRPER